MLSEIVEKALEYKRGGLSVIQIPPNTKGGGGIKWGKYTRTFATDKEIHEWFETEKDHNLAIVCGKISGNLEILDLDDPSLIEFFKDVKTLTIKTQSNGYHLYFRVKKLFKTSTKNWGYPIDVRSEGGIGIAPPSRMNGNIWTIAREDKILEIESLEKFVLKHLPEKKKLPKKEENFIKQTGDIESVIRKYIPLEKRGRILQGMCPFHEDHTPSFTVYTDNYHCFGCGAHGDIVTFIQKIEKFNTRNEAIKKLEALTGIEYHKKINTDKLEKEALQLIKNWNIITIAETEILLKYANGIYIDALNDISKYFAEEFGLKDIPRKQNILTFIRDWTKKKHEEFDKNPYKINLKNGLYDIQEKKLSPHNPEHLSLIQIPVEYHENAKCPLTEKFISEIAIGKNQTTLWELLGYCLFPYKITQQLFILYGNGANGKSVYMDMLGELLSEENTSRISLDEIENSRFALAGLKNKLLNISSETVVANIKNLDQIKKLTGENVLEGEIKFVQKRLKFKPITTFICGTNELLPLDNPNYAEKRRLVFVNFPNQFKKADADPYLLEKLTSKEEQEGQLRKGLEHLTDVLKNKEVHDSLNDEKKEDLLEKGTNQVNSFLEDEFDWEIESEQIWIENKCLYQMLKEYCEKNSLITPSNWKFKKVLKKEHQNSYGKFEGNSKFDNIHNARKRMKDKLIVTWKLAPMKKYDFIAEEQTKDNLTLWHL